MPAKEYLAIMGIKLWKYKELSPEEKQKFTDEAQKEIAKLQHSDPEGYTEFINKVNSGEGA